jgi:hypothetical protein
MSYLGDPAVDAKLMEDKYGTDWLSKIDTNVAAGPNVVPLTLVPAEEPIDKDIGSKAWSKRVRKKAKQLSGELETGYMELARILYWVCDTKSTEPPYESIFKEWGFATFDNYAQEELNLHERKAKSLRRIWFRLEVELSGLDSAIKKEIISLGWTKVRELIRVLTIANSKEWVERAKQENYSTLCVSIRKYLYALEEAQKNPENQGKSLAQIEPALPPKETYVHKHLALEQTQADVVEAALQKASVLAGSTSDNHLLTLICSDFVVSNNLGKESDAKARYLARVEETLGIKLIAFDPKTKNILYGAETLVEIANSKESE